MFVFTSQSFKEGLGATLQVAIQIFSDLKKSMVADSVADLSASINVLDTMSSASETITLDNSILDVSHTPNNCYTVVYNISHTET